MEEGKLESKIGGRILAQNWAGVAPDLDSRFRGIEANACKKVFL